MKISRLVTMLTCIACFCMPLSVSASLVYQVDFQVQVDRLEQYGDVSVVGNPTRGLTVGDILSGSFRISTPQLDETPRDDNEARYVFTDLTIGLPNSDAFSLLGTRGVDSKFRIDSQKGSFFGSDFTTTEPFDLEVGDLFFFEDMNVYQNMGGTYFNVNVLNIDTINEIASTLVNGEVSYSYNQQEAFINAKNVLSNRAVVRDAFNGVILNTSVRQIPEPASGLLLLVGFGALASFKRRAKTHI